MFISGVEKAGQAAAEQGRAHGGRLVRPSHLPLPSPPPPQKERFELEVLGKNGMHVDGDSVGAGGVVPLRSRAKLRAADASFHFLLPRDPSARPLVRRKRK